jgi:vacuolar-type H+-ATPase subunit I/STV1
MEFENLDKKVSKKGTVSYWKGSEIVYKQCTKCKEIKSVDEYSKNKGKPYGLNSQCKICEKQWFIDNAEYRKEYKKVNDKQYRENNKEKIREIRKRYYEQNKEKMLAKSRAYKQAHKKVKKEKPKCYEEFNGELLEKRVNKIGGISYWKDDKMVYKQCSKCKEIKSIEEYNGIKKKDSSCKECLKVYNIKTKEHRMEYKKQNKERDKEVRKKYYEKHKEELNKKSKIYRLNHKEEVANLWKEYYSKNKEELNAHRREINPIRSKERRERYIKGIESILEQINPLFKELNLPIYGYIYKIENIKTGKVYIGQTVRPLNERYKVNIVEGWIKDRKTYSNQKFLEELIEEDFKVTDVLDVGFCKWHLDKIEAHYINEYNSCENGYNNCAGNYESNDGLEEFKQILNTYNLEFKDNKIIKKD